MTRSSGKPTASWCCSKRMPGFESLRSSCQICSATFPSPPGEIKAPRSIAERRGAIFSIGPVRRGAGADDNTNYIRGPSPALSRAFLPCSNQPRSFCCWSSSRSACPPGATGLPNPGETGRRQTAPAPACCRCRRSMPKPSSAFTARARFDGRRYSPSTPGSSSRSRMPRRIRATTTPPGGRLSAPTDLRPMRGGLAPYPKPSPLSMVLKLPG